MEIETVKKFSVLIISILISNISQADHHSLALEATQPEMEWTITSIDMSFEHSVITAETNSSENGRSYASYHLSYDRDGAGGTYTANGRSYLDGRTMTSAYAAGVWHRDGVFVVMEEIVSHSDGSRTVGRITIDPLERTMMMVQYALN